MKTITHEEVKSMPVGARFILGYIRDGEETRQRVMIDSITEQDISCVVLGPQNKGSYVSLMLQNPYRRGGPWDLNVASNGRDKFAFYEDEETPEDQIEEGIHKTERGFICYGKFRDSRGQVVTVKESSAAGDPHCYVFVDSPHSPHLTVEQAGKLIVLLQRFIDHSNNPDHWKNDPDYIKVWRSGE